MNMHELDARTNFMTYGTWSLPCTVRARPLSFGRVHSSKSQRECVPVMWPHIVTGLLTGNLTVHALANCALPCHGYSAGEANVYTNHLK